MTIFVKINQYTARDFNGFRGWFGPELDIQAISFGKVSESHGFSL